MYHIFLGNVGGGEGRDVCEAGRVMVVVATVVDRTVLVVVERDVTVSVRVIVSDSWVC